MNAERFVLAFYPDDEEAPSSLRTHSREDAVRIARNLNAARSEPEAGKWLIHEVLEGINP